MVKIFETFMQGIAALVASFFGNMTLFFAPLTPAIMFGYSVFDALSTGMGNNVGLMAGVASAISLEGAGYGAFKEAGKSKSIMGWIPVAFYFAIGIFVVATVKADGWQLALGMFGIVGLVYYNNGKSEATQAVDEKVQAEERDEKDFERKLKLAKLEAQKEIALAKVSAPSESFHKVSEGKGKVSETFPKDSRRFTAENWEQLRQMLATMSRADVAKEIGVSERTVTNWSAKL